jgi:mRNA interferase YafQ
MRTIRFAARYKRDYRRQKSGVLGKNLDCSLRVVIGMLEADQALPERFRDHALSGEWKDYRDCHIFPDLVLIYRKPDETSLELVRLGSHSELSL